MEREPLPLSVRNRLRRMIQDGRLQPGDQLPSEAVLAAELGVGRSTIREALRLLEHEGMVDVQPGRGRFVVPLGQQLIEKPITHFQSTGDLLRELGYDYSSRVLHEGHGGANEEEAQALGVPLNDPVIRLVRVRLHKNQPIVYLEETFSRSLFTGPIDSVNWAGSLTTLLANQGHHPVSSQARIRAVGLPPRIKRRLKGLDRHNWIEITETDHDAHGNPCLFSRNYLRGDMFVFNFRRRVET